MHRRIGHEEKISTIFGIVYWGAINGKTKSKEPRKLNDFATQIKLSNCCHIHWLFQRNSFCWFAPSDFHNEWFHGIRRPKRSFDVVKITFAVFRNNYLLLLWCNIDCFLCSLFEFLLKKVFRSYVGETRGHKHLRFMAQNCQHFLKCYLCNEQTRRRGKNYKLNSIINYFDV